MPNRGDKGLGRLRALDARDFAYRTFTLAPVTQVEPRSHYWSMFDKAMNQGGTPQCVAYSWTHFRVAAPIVSQAEWYSAEQIADLYQECQRNDEWDGEGYEGTSVRAGAKVLQARGVIREYRWAVNAEEARAYVISRGPMIFGTDWHDGMFEPDSRGFIRPTGPVVGGHAYCVIGYSLTRNAFRVVNSWGTGWGDAGRCWLAYADADVLIQNFGEVCSGMEVKPTPRT